MPIRTAHIIPALLGLLLLAGCDATKRLPEGERLLVRNRVTLAERGPDPAELETIIKQQPNKRILRVPFYLHLYNLRDPHQVAAKRARHDSLCAIANEARGERGKRPKRCDRSQRGRNGEAPVVLDPVLVDRSTEQMRLYMRKEGWFLAEVRDSIHHRHRRPGILGGGRGREFRKPKAEVEYTVTPGPMYRLRGIRFEVDDPDIERHVQAAWPNSLLKTGDRFDADMLDRERNRITDRLRDIGYLFFNRDLVRYDADTTVGGHQVDVVMHLERPHARERKLQGTPEGTVYTLGEVTLATLPPTRTGVVTDADTLYARGYRLLYEGRPPYRPEALTGMVFLQPGDRYRQSNTDRTYRRLNGLRVFDRVEIGFDTTATAPGIADARVDLLPGRTQSVSGEAFATNRGGFLGTSASVGYRHRNLFRGMGSLQLLMVLGLEAQQRLTGQGSATEEETVGNVGGDGFFNTVDIGPELTLRFPHFLLPVRRDRFARSATPGTVFTALYNHQRRPDFTRTLAKVSFGYDWAESQTKSWAIYPVEVNVIRIPRLSDDFAAYLQAANDPVLTDSYTDHLIAGMRGQFVHNTQGLSRRRDTYFSRITLEWAGHPMLVPLSLLAQESIDGDGNSFFSVGGIRYAEYIKVDSDLRWRRVLHEKSSLAFRVAAGAGLPYGNLGVLPFESAFFVGGANGLRAWRARSLGPGSYNAPLLAFDRIGELRLEGNAEYRFKLIGFLEGALFADVGNIWNWNDDPRRPGAAISADFLSELAVGTGVGARLNFDFFIVRFDLGMQTKDPSLPPGERWLFQPKDQYEAALSESVGSPVNYRTQFNFNLGIGYPF